ncbi:transposase, partial [Buttiauxella izardii]
GIWVPSPRKWDGKTPEVSYPEGAKVYRVRSKGDIYIGKRLFLNQALRGEYVMLEEREDGLEAIIFNRMDLAYYDRRKQSIIRID